MSDENCIFASARRTPWNKGKLIGAKPPLRPNQVWSIRTRLLIEGRARNLALFNLAIDSKLRGCDVVALKVDDVAPNGYAVDRATVRQRKTGSPVKFGLTDQTRQAVDDYLKAANKKSGEYLFTGRRGQSRAMSTRQYARLLADWVASIGLDPKGFGTHSLRRTKATLIYRRTGNLRAVQRSAPGLPHGIGRDCQQASRRALRIRSQRILDQETVPQSRHFPCRRLG